MARKTDRLFWRPDRNLWYMDLRSLGGGKQSTGTGDRDEASRVLARTIKELQASSPLVDNPTLTRYAVHHLGAKKLSRRPGTVERDRQSLRYFTQTMGDMRLSKIDVPLLTRFVSIRIQRDGVAAQTVLHELHALSSLFKRAIAEGKAKTNPVRDLPDKPRVERPEAVWLEVHEAAALLEASGDPLRAILSAFLLTGGRKNEVLGLCSGDVDHERKLVHFRPNRYRLLKSSHHARHVPLWPQLEEELGDIPEDSGTLLFPGQKGRMKTDLRSALHPALERAGIKKKVTLHTLRHTYAAARMQTLDHGHPISPYTVMRELGHQSLALIEKTYGHLSHTRERADEVRYAKD